MNQYKTNPNNPLKIELYESEKLQDYKLKYINNALPQPVFRWIFSAPSNSGKSTLIKNILFNKNFGYKYYFDEIYAFIGSLDDVLELDNLVKSNDLENKICISNVFDEYKLNELYNNLEKDNSKRKSKIRSLFIFDDMITNNICNRTKMNIIDKIFIQGRHIQASVIITTQKYKALNNNIRQLNATHLTVFSGTQQTDLEQISEEHSNTKSKEQLQEIFKNNLDRKFNFITIDNKNFNVRNQNFEVI